MFSTQSVKKLKPKPKRHAKQRETEKELAILGNAINVKVEGGESRHPR